MDSKVVLIVLNYNDYMQTIQLIKTVCEYSTIDQIVIIDNCSVNNSYGELMKYKTNKIEVIQMPTNGGFAKGNNFGIHYAIQRYAPEFFIIANPDVLFSEDTAKACLKMLDRQDVRVGLTAPSMKSLSGIRTLPAWKLPNKREMYLNNFMLLRKCIHLLEYPKAYFTNESSYVDVLPGSLLFCKANTLKEVSYFDEETFLYGEENILAYKLKEKGYVNILMNQTQYDHVHGKTINGEIKSVRKRFDLCLEGYLIYTKNYLNMNKIEIALFILTYKIGLINYLLLRKIRDILLKL